jgi:TonB family protein
MTVNGKSVQNPIHSKTIAVIVSVALAAALLGGLTPAFAQQDSTLVTHFLDSNTDRVPLLTAFPTYPSIARRDRIEGEAKVCFMIKKDGRIARVRLRSATHKIFKKPALRAIKKSTFEPLAPNQVYAMSRTCRTYRFRLEPILVDNATN